MRDLRLLGPACAAWAAAWLAVTVPDLGIGTTVVATWAWGAATVLLLLSAWLAVARGPRLATSRRRWVVRARHPRHARTAAVAATLLVAFACAALVSTAAAVGLGARERSALAEPAESRRTVEVVVEVTRPPQPMKAAVWASAEPLMRVDGTLVAVDGDPVRGVPVTVGLGGAEAEWGAHVSFSARASSLPAAEPNAFRMVAPGEVSTVSPAPAWLAWAGGLRDRFADAATELGGDGGALVPGLAIGDTSAVGTELDTAMKTSSLSHLTAVSGANCAIVTAAAFGLAALCGLGRGARVAVALVALSGFVVLVTPQPSVIRAAAMAVVILVGMALARSAGGVSALSLAVVILLTVDPWLARDYGFALSAAATAGLLLLAAPLARRLADVMPTPLAVVLAVPVAAQLACQPVLVLLDPSIALYGVPANLLAAPAAPVGTIVGMVGCLVLPLLPSVGYALMQVAWVPASWIALVAHGAAALPGARLPWPADAIGALLLVAVTAASLWLAMSRPRPGPARRVIAVAVLLLVAVPTGISVGPIVVARAQHPADWDVANCDVGQGDAVLVRSEGATALIDTGPDPAALERCLSLLGVATIDLLVLTHWDADHVAGVPAVVGRVGVVIHGPLDGTRSSSALEPLEEAGAEAIEVEAGRSGTLGDSRWRVLWPRPKAQPGNDASVVLEVNGRLGRAIFLGDLGEEAQARLVASADLARVDLVKVAHHGSADQSERLYELLRGTVGIVGVGADNGYGHPTDRLLDLLEGVGTTAVRSDRSGTSLLTAVDGGGYRLWVERDSGDVAPRP
ncbi:ComEC/Rec2 family competence protein [Agromyces salentinus]|uniref:ComEC/Rec2 family competence protein n=1 Tax=Agromyces salentinus TaxID=269421 RepID=A0ABP4Z2C0_9MICO|nr:ComEC/Rec2 family competence protein [Agromyces salentinus]